jgi:ribose transport system permease protein
MTTLANRQRNAGRSGLSIMALGLPVALFAALAFASPSFLGFQNIANVNSQVTALLIVALGQLIVAISGGIDLSVGSVLSLTSVILVTVDPTLAVPVALAAGVAVGLVNGVGVAAFGVHPLVMTLATMTFLQGLALLILPVPGGDVPDYLESLATFSLLGLPAAFFWCVVFVSATTLLLRATRFGTRIFAIGANADNAARNGVAVLPHRIACYVLCSVGAVMAGIFLTGRVSSADATMGASYALESVTVIALGGVQLAGGVGSVTGAVAGAITLGLMANGMNLLGISPFIRAASTGLLLLAAVSMQPRKAIGA